MKKKQLEIILSNMKDMIDPKPEWEQYLTPSRISSSILFEAMANGDIEGKKICELGCGPGPFMLGSYLMGAGEVIGIDIDERAIQLARENFKTIIRTMKDYPPGDYEFILHDLERKIPMISGFDTVFMNPPFGAQKRHADRPFIERAMEIAPVCYSIHNGNSGEFLSKMAGSMGIDVQLLWRDQFEIPARFFFHRKEKKEINVIVVRFRR